MTIWSVVEPLLLTFTIDIPIETNKTLKPSNNLKTRGISNLTRSDLKAEIVRLAVAEKIEIEAIASRLNTSPSTVRRVCRTHKIGYYSVDKSAIVSHSSQAPFGWNVVQGRLQKNAKEWPQFLEIQRLRSEGNSLHKIADILTSRNVPTKNGGRWFAKTVSQILDFNSQHLPKSTNKGRKHGNR